MKTQSLADLQSFFQKASLYVWDWHLEVQKRLERDLDELVERDAHNPAVSDEDFSDRYHYLKTRLANTHRYSVLPMLMGVFERTLKQFCRVTMSDYREAVKRERGGWFRRHQRLLQSHGFNLNGLQKEIGQIPHLLELRHCITHAFGEIAGCDDPAAVRRAIAAIESTDESREGFLFVNPLTVATARCATRFIIEHVFRERGYPTDYRLP